MSRRGSTPEPPERDSDSGPNSMLDARVRVRRGDIHQIIRTVYSVSAIVLWAAIPIGAWRLAPPLVGAAVDLTHAMTRVSVALERSSEGTAEIKATAKEIRDEQREQGDMLRRMLRDCPPGAKR